MANNLGGLFDSDPGFLEELASGAEETPQPQQMQGIIPQQNIGMMSSVQQQPQQRQPQQGYNNMTSNMPTNNFGNMQFPNQQQQQPQQQQFVQSNFNQYTNQPMYNQNAMVSTAHGQSQSHMMQNSSHQPQFSNQSGSMMQHQGQVLYNYNAAGGTQTGPSLPNTTQQQPAPQQQQPMKVMRMQGWNQNPQMYNQQQQQQQPVTQSQQQYLSHHDYAVTTAAGQQQMHIQQPQQGYPSTQPQPNQAGFMQRMTSPTRIQTSQPSQPNMVNMQAQMFPQNNVTGNQNFANSNIGQAMTSDSVIMPQQQQQSQPFIQGEQSNNGQYQQFSYHSPPQGHAQSMGDKVTGASPQQSVMRFPQTSPTLPNAQHRMQFNSINTMPQQRAGNPMLSPRPTPPPASPSVAMGMLSPTGSTSSHQGGFNSMEPSPQSNNTGMFQQNSNPDTMVTDLNQPSFSSPPQNNDQMLPIGNPTNVNVNMNLTVPGNGNFQTSPGQVSPNFKGVSPTATPKKKVQAEINSLNQQIQQLYSLPQTPQTQQNLLDLQEKLRLLQSQPTTNARSKKGKTTKKQQQAQAQAQAQAQQQIQMQSQPQQQQGLQPQQPMMNQGQPQQSMVQQGQPQPQQAGTVTLQLNNSGQANQGAMQSGQKIHLVPSTGPQKVFIIQQPGQQAATQSQTPSSLPQHQAQHIIINSNSAAGAQTQHLVIQNPSNIQQQPGNGIDKNDTSQVQQQEKANKIIAEAIAKAQKAGNTAIPRILDPPELPATLADVENPDLVISETPEKPKKKRRTPKKDKDKEKDKDNGKEKTPRPKKSRKDKKAAAAAAAIAAVEGTVVETVSTETKVDAETMVDVTTTTPEKPKRPKKKRSHSEKKANSEGTGTPKSSKKSRKPPATFLSSKKRKRGGSSEGSDVEMKVTPPPSPENDEFKRRSGRVKRKKYLDDVDLNLSDDDLADNDGSGGKADNPSEEDSIVVDKILGSRTRQRDPDDENVDEEEVDEFFVKYKNFSYLHCEWKTEAEIRDKRFQGKLRRYKQKKQQVTNYFDDDEEFFNPDYVEVDRVLEESFTRDPGTQEEVVHYLVKWRSLPYEDSTWELQQDVDPEKVKLFKKFRELPLPKERSRKPRPKPSDWVALDKSHCYKNENCLREYQLEGVNWLTFCWHKKNNCILADEMGLGKTIQSIAYLQEIFNYGIRGPFLVVAPLSTIANWQREFETWTDMNAITYHGTSPSRYMLQEYEMYFRDDEGNKIKEYYRFHALITTYELILSDMDLLKTIEWRALIVDEAHRLKNKNCSLIKGLRLFNFEHKVLLSGTPLQNNVEELFSLLNFLEPNQFSSSDAFAVEFGTLKTEEQVEKLKAILKPMMLRRLKEDVEKNLAAKEETIIEVELTNMQKKYYRAILERNFTYLCKGTQSAGNVPSLMNTMMELRKCCNHPYLINGAEENILAELRSKDGKEPEHIQALIQASGKFVLLDKLLPKLKQNGNRVLIFSQMIRVLDIIEDYLIHKRYMYERLDGRIRGNLRQEAIDRYSKPDSDRFVFLICTKAGGLGINLTAADTVIIYDSDWNPQNDLQAQARCHRIGQSKMVMVYRLITRNSYEREMFDRASMKLGLDRAVLQSMGSDKMNPQMQLSKKEVEELLKKGAYGALMEDDNAGDRFCEEDIDQILKGRTQVIQIESEGKGSTFAKASFTVTSNRDDIDINDPEFWQKWAKRADVDVESLDKKEQMIVDEPRVRKKTARYGNNDGLQDISDLGSDSNTDDEGSRKGRKSKRGRRGGDDDDDFERQSGGKSKGSSSGYGRSELFKVEKGLLHYGWGRWNDIMSHARFKRPMGEKDVENVAKAILLFGLQFYKGDERIKEFIFDLISQTNHQEGLKNHSGLSAPVPRGRKGKKLKSEETQFDANVEIDKAGIKIDRDIVTNKNAYRRHIQRHSNKVLLRVRTLYYLKHEVLGDAAEQIDQGRNVRDIHLQSPIADTEPPVYWWDEISDISLLVGVYKHGYEKYNLMRQDPCLIFLSRCGPPDNAALAAELKDDDDNDNDDLDDTIVNDDDESLPAPDKEMTPKPSKEPIVIPEEGEAEEGKLPFPTVSELNTRLRRIITNYQRDFKKQQMKIQQQAKKMEKREKLDAMFREREARRRETLQKWTRREEMDFYRVVSTYGIEFDRVKGRYIWDKFRVMARLEKKTDEQLTEYFISFYHMCLRVCRKIKEEGTAYPPTPVYIEPITEERANRCIARIDLLSKIREEIIIHPRMEGRIKDCKSSLDLPKWWTSGKHDRELLVGAAKHGLARTEFYIMNDPNLCFIGDIKSYVQNLSTCNSPANFKKEGNSDTPDLNQTTDKTEDGKDEGKDKSEDKKEDESENTDSTTVKEETEKDDEETEKPSKESEGDAIVKEEQMETDDSVVKKEDEELMDVKTEMEADDDVKVKVETTDVKKEVKEETVVKDEVNTEDVKEEKDGVDSVKKEGAKEDEEVRIAMEGEESQSEILYNVSDTLLSQWPKDRVVFHRLEQICYCIETGEWPFPSKMKSVHILGIDSNSNTPTRSSTPCLTPKQEDEVKEVISVKETIKKKEKDFEVHTPEQNEGLKMTFHKKAEKQKLAMEAEAEKAAKIQAILAQSLAASQASSGDSQPEPAFSQVSWPSPWQPSPPYYMVPQVGDYDNTHYRCPLGGAESPFLNGSHMSEEEMLMNRTMMEQGMMFARGRRGRKRKAEKMAEIAMAEALARRQTARALATLDADARVPLINLEDGSRLTGDEAPRKKELESWLDQHPGFMVDTRDMEEIEEGEIVPEFPERRKGRKPKFDPAFLDVDKLTGEENVSVINRLTGKKITGAKAPPLRYLAEWLEQNPMWDVDPKWADLVRAKGSLPKTLLPRVVAPSRRGRRPRDSPLSHSMTGVTDPHQAAALAASLEAMNAANLMAAGYGKLPMPFGSLPGLGMNPLLGLSGFGFPGMPGASPLATEKSETPSKDSKCSTKEEGEKIKDEEKASSSSPHPTFPFMFNPLMYNPALLASQGLNFPLPTSLSTSGSGLINGHPQAEEEPVKSKSRHSDHRDPNQAEDLSVKSKSKKHTENMTEAHSSGRKSESKLTLEEEDMPCDLSIKPKSKEDKSKQKICSSDKLSRIVDTLKFRVNKMDEKPLRSGQEEIEIKGGSEIEVKRSSIDPMLNVKEMASASPVSKKEHTESGPSKKELLNSLQQKISANSPPNHAVKEPLPKIVEELLAAKQQRDKEELMIKQQQKLDSLMLKKEKLLIEAAVKQKLAGAQGSDVREEEMDEDDGQSSPGMS